MARIFEIKKEKTALVIVDLQNDFVRQEAYGLQLQNFFDNIYSTTTKNYNFFKTSSFCRIVDKAARHHDAWPL